MKKIILVFFLIILNIDASLGMTIDQTRLPLQNEIQLYISNLLNSYNSLINYFDLNDVDFEKNKRFFSLYRNVGDSFKVICVKADINDNNFINCIFVPISSNNPIIIIDFKHELRDYFPGLSIKASSGYLKGGLFRFSDTILYADYIIFLKSSDISNNTLKNSKEMAEYFYKNNQNDIRINQINQAWGAFKEENKKIIWNNSNLYQKEYEIDKKIDQDNSYTYDLFLLDFNRFNISVTMIKKWEEWVNSEPVQYLVKNFDVKDFPEIDNKAGEIKFNMFSNETYSYSQFETDLRELNQMVQLKIGKNWGAIHTIISILFVLIGAVFGKTILYKSIQKCENDNNTLGKSVLEAFWAIISPIAGLIYFYTERPEHFENEIIYWAIFVVILIPTLLWIINRLPEKLGKNITFVFYGIIIINILLLFILYGQAAPI